MLCINNTCELESKLRQSRISVYRMSRKLQFEENAAVLAKDASLKEQKGDDWFEIDDPRNPINQRRSKAKPKH